MIYKLPSNVETELRTDIWCKITVQTWWRYEIQIIIVSVCNVIGKSKSEENVSFDKEICNNCAFQLLVLLRT